MKFLIKNNLKSLEKGFTLIEIMIATSLFAVIAVLGVSIISASEKVYARINSTRLAMDNLTMIAEVISRDLKFSRDYKCVFNSGSDTSFSTENFTNTNTNTNTNTKCIAISFSSIDKTSSTTVYYFHSASSSIYKADFNKGSTGGYTLEGNYQMNSKDLIIKNLSFEIENATGTQPKAKIFLSGAISKSGDKENNFYLQTMVSQRPLNIK